MIPNDEVAYQVAAYLLQIKAVKLQPQMPFTWSSGWKSPVYCDNRLALSYPPIRSYIKEQLAKYIKQFYPETEAIAGIATAGIAQGALVADYLQLPFVYVRPEPKKHGLGNQIEGRLQNRQKVVLVEDLISTGGSSLRAVAAVREAGSDVLGVAAIFSYGFQIAVEHFKSAHCLFFSLSDYEHLLTTAWQAGYIKSEELSILKKWREAPAEWGKNP